MRYLAEVFDKKRIKLLIAAGASLLLALIVTLVCVKITGKQSAQEAAARWSNDESFSQVSVFLSELSGFDEKMAKNADFSIISSLSMDSLYEASEEKRSFVSAYCAKGQVRLESSLSNGSFAAYGVSGDFFLFHPFDLISGSFFDSNYVMDDLIIIDKEVAWNLFGSTDVVGQVVNVGNRPHVVCGVINRNRGKINDLAGNSVPTVYLSYNSLMKFGTGTYISTYEALLPNPVSGYALETVKKGVAVSEDSFEIVENTGRFHWTKLLKNVKNFGTRGMNAKAVVYPFWENVARGTEDYLTPITVLAFLLFLFPCGILLYILGRMWKRRPIHFSDIKGFFEKKRDEYYIKKQNKRKKESEAQEEENEKRS